MFFINPFIYAGGGDFESIATVTVGSGGASEIEFTNIPGTYQHLQLRGIGRISTSSTYWGNLKLQLNGDTADSTYSKHILYGNGASAGATGDGGDGNGLYFFYTSGNSSVTSMFGAVVMDILDYASTSKNKTVRAFGGWDNNGTGSTDTQKGYAHLSSGMWPSTSAITSLKLVCSNLVQHSTYALYGVKAP